MKPTLSIKSTDDDAYYSGDKDYDWEYTKTSANALVALTIAAANIALT